MKNTILALLGTALLLTFISCNQAEESLEIQSSSSTIQSTAPVFSTSDVPLSDEIGLQDGHIVFHTEEAFENLSENLQNPVYVEAFKQSIRSKGDYLPDPNYRNYISHREEDHVKGFLWNTDQLFQVGNWYYKLDTDRMLLNYLHTDHSDQLADLIRGSRGGDIISLNIADGMGSEDDFGTYPTYCYFCLIGRIIGNPDSLPDVIGTSISCFLCKLELEREAEEEERDRNEE
ncbi:MAG: hypothetical protein AAF696_28240 [Bacteroidota bacterium]